MIIGNQLSRLVERNEEEARKKRFLKKYFMPLKLSRIRLDRYQEVR